MLDDDEKLLADGGYSGKDFSAWMERPTGLNNADQRMKQVARTRHECINGWLTKKNAGMIEALKEEEDEE